MEWMWRNPPTGGRIFEHLFSAASFRTLRLRRAQQQVVARGRTLQALTRQLDLALEAQEDWERWLWSG
jgi:hypothetical protein